MAISVFRPVAMSARIYVGRLSNWARDRDLERFFKGYGRIKDISIKNGYCFVVGVIGIIMHLVVGMKSLKAVFVIIVQMACTTITCCSTGHSYHGFGRILVCIVTW
jgi:RNA recognition motif. (a.k.a. RRM, RBD, or RNP domain)